MENLEDIQLPLLSTFMKLMKIEKDLPHRYVEPGSYFALVDLLREGYLLNSRDELIYACKKLWLKPFHRSSLLLNEKILEDILVANLNEYKTRKQPDAAVAPPPPVTPNEEKKKPVESTPIINPAEPVKSPDEEKTDKQQITSSSNEESLFLSVEEVDAGSNIGQNNYDNIFDEKNYRFDYQYLPVNRRFIEQTIRSLRYRVKGSGRPVIDIPATVEITAAKGFFDDWIWEEEDGFITQWTLLFDRDGSMVAFHSFQDALADAAFNGTLKNNGDLFYFRNVAVDSLYSDANQTRSRSFKRFADTRRKNILIVSDAGAARGFINEDRIDETYNMLYRLRKHRVAWLNPMPRERWQNTSAETIGTFVNMFEPGDDNADNLGNIVQLFKSKIIAQPSDAAW